MQRTCLFTSLVKPGGHNQRWCDLVGLCVCGVGLDILKIDKSSTDVYLVFHVSIWGLGALFGEISLPMATGLSRLWTKVE